MTHETTSAGTHARRRALPVATETAPRRRAGATVSTSPALASAQGDAWARSIERVATARARTVISGLALQPVGVAAWRATAPDGHIVGHIEQSSTPDGDLFTAQRYASHRGHFIALGEFWNLRDAAECLRNS